MRKLTLRHKLKLKQSLKYNSKSSGIFTQRVLVKSPIHTARIPLLRKLFPRASFIYIHRNPYEIYQSAVHMADTAYWYCYLNTPTDRMVMDFISWQFLRMWELYSSAAYDKNNGKLLPDILEIDYKDLASKETVLKTLHSVYKHSNISWTDGVRSNYIKELEKLIDYRPNNHVSLSSKTKLEIYNNWNTYFNAFSYHQQ